MKHCIVGAYCHFCDVNNLKRIDATPEEIIENLKLMSMAIILYQVEQIDKIDQRCPTCKGTGKAP